MGSMSKYVRVVTLCVSSTVDTGEESYNISKLYSKPTMEFVAPSDSDLKSTAKEIEWTVGAPVEELELSNDELINLENPVHRIKDGSGERQSVLQSVETQSASSDIIQSFRIDFSLLQKILYEHRRYALAQGFSDAEMDILRAIEFHREKRVGVDEIMEDYHAREYSESTIYKGLRTLQEKELIEKVRPGVYRYSGS